MSHPWKAQPYYMLLQPRTSAPVPAPMGSFGVRAALAGYTRGSFTPKSPWNVPKYVADEPTGVDGFRGFGQDQPGCIKPADAAAQLLPIFRQALQNWSLDVPGVGKIGPKIAPKVTAAMLEKAVVGLSSAVTGGTNAAKAWLKVFMRDLALSTVGSGVVSFVDSARIVVGDVWQQAADALVGAVMGVPPNVCGSTAVSTTISNPYDRYGPAMCPTLCTAAAAAGLSATQKAQLDEWCAGPTCQQTAAPIYTITGTAILPSQVVATGIRLAAKPALTTPAVAPKAGVSPLLIIGAAGLAAMLLLK